MTGLRCVFAGEDYSEGAVIATAGATLRCQDGVWERIREDGDSNANERLFCLTSADATTNEPPLNVAEIDTEADIPAHQYSRLRSVRCASFVNSGLSNLVNLANSCADHPMVSVRWISGSHQQDLKYRLLRGRSRLIRVRGQVGSILSTEPWDFGYGADMSDSVMLKSYKDQGGTAWTLWNLSSCYVCFKTKIAENGVEHITNWHVAAPNEEVRLWWSSPGVVSEARIVSARCDPL